MESSSLNGFPLWKRCVISKMLLSLFVAAALYPEYYVCGASVRSTGSRTNGNFSQVQNSSFSNRQSFDMFVAPNFVPSGNVHFNHHNQPVLGYPLLYPIVPEIKRHPVLPPPKLQPVHHASTNKKKAGKSKTIVEQKTNHTSNEESESDKRKTLHSEQLTNLKVNDKPQNDTEITALKVESKAEDDAGSQRGCPGCIGNECIPNLLIETKFLGLSFKRILAALAIGAAWAGFIALVIKIIKEQKGGDEEEGYGYGPSGPTSSPEYGDVTEGYGTSSTGTGYGNTNTGSSSTGYGSTGYNTNRISNRYYGKTSRSSRSFKELSDWVANAIDKLAELYEK